MMRIRTTCIVICCIVLAVLPASAANVKEQLQGITVEISKQKTQLHKKVQEERQVSGELVKIQNSLREKEQALLRLNTELQTTEQKIHVTRNETDLVRVDAERRREQLQRRLVALYKSGDINDLRLFFSAESFPEMVELFRYMKAVLKNDRQMVQEYMQQIEHLQTLVRSFRTETQKQVAIKSSIEAKKREIEADRQAQTIHLANVRKDRQAFQQSLKELEANAKRLQIMVKRLEAAARKRYTPPVKSSKRPVTRRDQAAELTVQSKESFSHKGRLVLPVQGRVISRFGRQKHPEFNSYTFNKGIDIAAPVGSEIHAVQDGRVLFADYFKGYGNMVVVDHGAGIFSIYAHAARVLKRVGAQVSQGETVATVGDLDSTKGPVLYFEIRDQGKPVDPLPWFR